MGVWQVRFLVPSCFWCAREMSIADNEVNKFLYNQRMRYTFFFFCRCLVVMLFLLLFVVCMSTLPSYFIHSNWVIFFFLLLFDFIALSGDSFLFIVHSTTLFFLFYFFLQKIFLENKCIFCNVWLSLCDSSKHETKCIERNAMESMVYILSWTLA